MKTSDHIRTLIVDDEPFARESLRGLLAADPEIELVAECADGRNALRSIRELVPDLVFLDVQMPELDGFGVLQALGPERIPAVVFVTAFDRYALKAFEVHAIDYLLKPFDDERFRVALARAKAMVRQGKLREVGKRLADLLGTLEPRAGEVGQRGEGKARNGKFFNQIAIKSGGRVVFLRADEIDWVEAADDYVKLHVGPKWYLVRETMQSLEKRLDPRHFVRIHRSTIVSLNRIRELRPCFHGEFVVVLRDGAELKLSRSHRHNLESRIGNPL